MSKPAAVPPPGIPLAFFGSAIAALGAAPILASLRLLAPLALLHLLAVGVFATVAMGALYQFVPVVGMAPLRCANLAYVHLVLASIGTALLADGFQRGAFPLVAAGGAAHAAGAALEAGVLAATLAKGKNPAMPARLAFLALFWFLAAIGAGIVIARGGALPVRAHAAIGLAGFFGTLIAAVSFRLLRMFERVNVETRAPLRAALVSAAALIAIFVPRAGYAAAALAAALLCADLAGIAARRNPAYQPETFFYAAVSCAGGFAAAAAAALGAAQVAVTIALWFFTGCAVIGYLQRIVPFIWWLRRSRTEGARSVPQLGELSSPRLGAAILVLWCCAGAWWLAAPFTAAPALFALAAWALFIRQLTLAASKDGRTPAR